MPMVTVSERENSECENSEPENKEYV